MHTYTHTQSVASTAWTINHGLNVRPVVAVQVEYNGSMQTILPAAIEHPDLNTAVVRFTTPRSGTARLS